MRWSFKQKLGLSFAITLAFAVIYYALLHPKVSFLDSLYFSLASQTTSDAHMDVEPFKQNITVRRFNMLHLAFLLAVIAL